MQNPWDILSIYELQYFNCPSCVYKHHSKQEFVNHAYKIHPNSVQFLNKISDKSLTDIFCPWFSNEIKIENSQIKTEITTNEEFSDNDHDEYLNEPSNYLEVSVKDIKPELKISKKLQCNSCFKTFRRLDNLKKHIKVVHKVI